MPYGRPTLARSVRARMWRDRVRARISRILTRHAVSLVAWFILVAWFLVALAALRGCV